MVAGLNANGFEIARLEDVKADIEDAFREQFSANVRVDAESFNGQIIGVLSDRISDLWELAQKVYAYAYLDSAEGSALDDLVSLAGITRSSATYSSVTLTLGGVPGTIVPAGSSSKDSLGTLWVHDADVTIPGDTTAKPQVTGPVRGLATTIDTINTAVSGWLTVSNTLDASEGLAVESDAKLRQKYKLAFHLGLGASADAIRAALIRLDAVTEALVIENRGFETDSDGRPPKSYECVVRGGDDQEIVDTIWLAGPAGIETFGSESGTSVDGHGDGQTVNFSRPTEVSIYVRVDIETEEGFPDDGADLVRDEILAFGDSFFIGQSVYPFKIAQHIETDFIKSATIYVGLSSSPSMSDPILLARNELALFDSSFIEVNKI